jgi:hypothetical protein
MQFDDITEVPLFRHRNQRAASLGSLGRDSARADVSSSASPLWCLAEHLRGDIATHGEPDQRESRRRRTKNRAGDGVHGFVPTVIRNRDRAKRPKRRNLIGIKVAPST